MFSKKKQAEILKKMLKEKDHSSGLFPGCINRKVLSDVDVKNVLCPYDGRLLIGCEDANFNKECSNYCLKDVIDLLPNIRESILNKMLLSSSSNKYNIFYFKKKNISIPPLLSKEEKTMLQNKLEEKITKNYVNVVETEEYKIKKHKEQQLRKNLICIYGNTNNPIPKSVFKEFLDKISPYACNTNIIEMNSKSSYNIWHNNNYAGNFLLNDISIGISYYIENNKKFFWCLVTKGDNITTKNLNNRIVIESLYQNDFDSLFLLFKNNKNTYNSPSNTIIKQNDNIVPYENLLCDTCTLVDMCNGGCPYRKIVNGFISENNERRM